ncbi:MAG: Unknown protein [uncultured Sulfurovum sp.]|uniref:Uncharacterized protein n=1 Tax=uncultured Sulfurovum sp. TaxID=269237 RepID=A0A6S6RWX7_9BACT|nr:MAG: Unknown protein [uncultured Sulfurovum sp.]
MFNEERLYSAQRSIVKNWIFFVVIFLLILFWQVTELRDLRVELARNTALQEQSMTSVIGLTDNGVVLDIERKALFADNEEALVVRALRKLVVARAELTNGFTVSKFEDATLLLESVEKLHDFTEYLVVDDVKAKGIFIDVKNIDGDIEEKSVLELSNEGVGYFKGYLEKLRQMIQANTLAHFATIYKTEVKSYVPDGSNFKIRITFHVSTQNWVGYNKEESVFTTHDSQYEVIAKGFFNIRLRTKKDKQFKGINKLGLHFYHLKISIPIAKGK